MMSSRSDEMTTTEMTTTQRFPERFLWGAATSAYQIEGSPLADGAGASIWQRFSHLPGRTRNGDTGDVACDHYVRYREDVQLMGELGLNAYRFSIAWGRVLPAGVGPINRVGLDFYDRLVDELLGHGIEPSVTLYHWDLPAALDDLGGWLNPGIAEWFAEYAGVVVRRLGDRVGMWATLNEPWVVSDGGYLHGALAPGHRSASEAPVASRNLLRAHGAGVQAARAEGASRVGIVINLEPKVPVSDRPADVEAATRADAYMNRQYLDPLLLGEHPPELREIFGDAWPEPAAGEIELIRQPIDFLGVNYYTRGVTRNDPEAAPVRASTVHQSGQVYTETSWEVYPHGLEDTLVWIKHRYGDLPLYVTENGAAFDDPPAPLNGRIHDPQRVRFFRDHLRAARRAIDAGVDLRGYFAWSLLDNFEWSLGYAIRFGIVHVDYATQRRTLKDSAEFYSRVIRTQGEALAS